MRWRAARRRPFLLCGLQRGQANQLGEQRIEALPVIPVKVDPADLLYQPLELLRFLEPGSKRRLSRLDPFNP